MASCSKRLVNRNSVWSIAINPVLTEAQCGQWLKPWVNRNSVWSIAKKLPLRSIFNVFLKCLWSDKTKNKTFPCQQWCQNSSKCCGRGKIKHFHDEGSKANIRCGTKIFSRRIGLVNNGTPVILFSMSTFGMLYYMLLYLWFLFMILCRFLIIV